MGAHAVLYKYMTDFEKNLLQKDVQTILHLQRQYKIKASKYKTSRFLLDILMQQLDADYIIGISGLRGSGKTVLLLQLLSRFKNGQNAVYISADMVRTPLFELAMYLRKKHNIKFLLIDEIHYAIDWARQIKQIYDTLDVKIYFTSSVSLDILKVREDLTRRVKVYNLPVLNLREFLALKYHEQISPLGFRELLARAPQFAKDSKYLDLITYLEEHFEEYLGAPLPSMLKQADEFIPLNILAKIIDQDMDNITELGLEDKHNIHLALRFLASISGGDISVSQLAKNIGVSRYKMQIYMELLQKAFVLHLVPKFGRSVVAEKRVLFNLPFRKYLSLNVDAAHLLGLLKEDFFVSMMRPYIALSGGGRAYFSGIYYLQKKAVARTQGCSRANQAYRSPDFLLDLFGDKYIVEVGGASKGVGQLVDVWQKKSDIPRIAAVYPYVGVSAAQVGQDYAQVSVKGLTIYKLPLVLFGMLW